MKQKTWVPMVVRITSMDTTLARPAKKKENPTGSCHRLVEFPAIKGPIGKGGANLLVTSTAKTGKILVKSM